MSPKKSSSTSASTSALSSKHDSPNGTLSPELGDENNPYLRSTRPRNISFRIANAIMTLFFVYCTYVQLNDPDSMTFIAFYSIHAISAFLNTFPFIPLDAPFLAGQLIGLYIMIQSIQEDNLWPLTEHININMVQELFDFHSESGRERAGVVIALTWTLASRSFPKLMSNMFMLLVALSICYSAYFIPKYGMTWDDVKDVAHCHGLGISPLRNSGALSGNLPDGHPLVKKRGGATCPFTGRSKKKPMHEEL